ncbi:MAG TPA: hypothetical protein VN317_01685 [Candidatus Methanoperedens sp.]|nr:hypothetical protein [Candidatus Methanoperedens sp.]
MSAPTEGPPAGGFSAEEDRLHAAGFATISAAMTAGEGFDAACARIDVADPDLRRIIIDDYIKVTIAQRHFQGGESTEAVAGALGISAERIEFARKEMLAEVAAASVDVFRRQGGQPADA